MVSLSEYEAYQAKNCAAIQDLIHKSDARPVLFLGSGFTRRYLGAPSWAELLKSVAEKVGIDQQTYNFLAQKLNNNFPQIGSDLVNIVHEWAWNAGRNNFPAHYFAADVDKSIFLKHLASEHIKSFQETFNDGKLKNEIELFKKTAPHAIITTNFDGLACELFPDFELIIGEKIIPMSTNIMGELYQIHGSVNDPASLVLTSADYERFTVKRRYISAKMMTYFAEYPVFILGYGLGDPNVNSIISDLGEAIKEKGGLLNNVFYVEWQPDMLCLDHLKEEHAIAVDKDSRYSLRVKTIVTTDFEWILKCIADVTPPIAINTKILRHYASRFLELVRKDIPKRKIEIDYTSIEKISKKDAPEFAMVLGISATVNPNITYPHTISQAAEVLGYKHWVHVQRLLPKANAKVGFDIKAEDSPYHFAFKSGKKAISHKYSDEFIELIRSLTDETAAP